MPPSAAKVRPPAPSQPWPGPPKKQQQSKSWLLSCLAGGRLGFESTAPAPALHHSQASRCPPPCPQHRPGLAWAARTWLLLHILKGELRRDLGSGQTGGETPWHLLGLPSWSLGRPSGTTGCFLNPTSHLPKALTSSRARCQRWEPPWAPGRRPAKPVGRCHPHANAGSIVLAIPNDATAPWQQERQARHKSFSETHSKSELR